MVSFSWLSRFSPRFWAPPQLFHWAGGTKAHEVEQNLSSCTKISYLPSRELTYPTLGKGKSSSKHHFWGSVSSLEGIFFSQHATFPKPSPKTHVKNTWKTTKSTSKNLLKQLSPNKNPSSSSSSSSRISPTKQKSIIQQKSMEQKPHFLHFPSLKFAWALDKKPFLSPPPKPSALRRASSVSCFLRSRAAKARCIISSATSLRSSTSPTSDPEICFLDTQTKQSEDVVTVWVQHVVVAVVVVVVVVVDDHWSSTTNWKRLQLVQALWKVLLILRSLPWQEISQKSRANVEKVWGVGIRLWGIRSWVLLILHTPIHHGKLNLYRFACNMEPWQERNTYQTTMTTVISQWFAMEKLQKHQPTKKKMHLHHPIPFPSPQNHQRNTYHHQQKNTKKQPTKKTNIPKPNQPVLDHDHNDDDNRAAKLLWFLSPSTSIRLRVASKGGTSSSSSMAFFPRRSVFPFFFCRVLQSFLFLFWIARFFLGAGWLGVFFVIACFLMFGIVEFLEDAYVFVVVEWIFSVTHGDAVNVTCLRSYLFIF